MIVKTMRKENVDRISFNAEIATIQIDIITDIQAVHKKLIRTHCHFIQKL